MSFKPYSKYKESGVEWLGRVPEHWTVMPIRLAARLESGHTPSRNHPEYWENCTIPWFTLADVWQIREGLTDVVTETKEKVSELGVANSAARVLPAGTVMLSRTASVGFSAIMGVDMATTQDFANWVCGPDVVPRFLLQAFRAMGSEFRRLMMGSTHNTIYMPDIASFRFVLPPPAEQSAVVSFIDHETAKIDALIAEQQRLIELLQEKRQAVISHAVTKGLNPDAPMKDSGIEWLGEVPEHWATPPVFVRYEAVLGKMVDEKKATGSHPVPYLRNADVYWDQVNTTDLPTLDIQPHERTRFTVRKGDVLICEGGAGIGQTAIWQGEDDTTAFQKALHRLRPWDTTKEDPRYFSYCMRFAVESGRLLAGGTATIPHLTGEQLRRYRFPCPPLCDQQAIVQFLDEDGRQIDALQESATKAITLLQERRSALISAAVTGQIDVRGFAGGSEAA